MMLFHGRLLFKPLLLLIIVGSSEAFNTRQSECNFPSRWEGNWFQSGVRQSILISRNILSSKGRCIHNEGDKYLLVDEKSCYRCVVIHEKHSNVLQYKETYCHNRNSLSSLCSYITGDALLYSMFREEAAPVRCPFHGPMTFSYNRGHGICSVPQSNIDSCTDDSKLLFRYQACPDIHASESAVEELECLATWKEGSNRYLVGRLHHSHPSSNEERYRCFVYERAGQTVGTLSRASSHTMGIVDHERVNPPGGPVPEGSPEIYNVAQSGDATCNGLFSPNEGSRTMTLKKVSSPGQCQFPGWLTGHTINGLTWHNLDMTRSYSFHSNNATLHVTRSNSSVPKFETGSMDFQSIPEHDEHFANILCNSIIESDSARTMIVAHFTVGCRSGYMCMTFYKRDNGHVVEIQTGNAVARSEEACSSPHYLQHSTPYVTLVQSVPEPRQCPYLGKFTVTGINRIQKNNRKSRSYHNEPKSSDQDKVRHSTEERLAKKLNFEVNKRHVKAKRITRQSGHERSDKSTIRHKIDRSRRAAHRLEDFQVDADDFTQMQGFWSAQFNGKEDMLQVQDDYFGDYEDDKNPPKKRFFSPQEDISLLTYQDLARMTRGSESDANLAKKRKKREETKTKCHSGITTLIIGCSTADKMELLSDCIDDDTVTAYSCHGRWLDAEGTQFVIATPLARRTSWTSENNKLQPYRNTRRLCFMYRESGGVVSLTASSVACQRGFPRSPPMLAFNATSIGQCMDDSSTTSHRASYLMVTVIAVTLALIR